jgi:hypothetical protein
MKYSRANAAGAGHLAAAEVNSGLDAAVGSSVHLEAEKQWGGQRSRQEIFIVAGKLASVPVKEMSVLWL